MQEPLQGKLRKKILKDHYFPKCNMDLLCKYIIACYYDSLEQDGLPYYRYEKNLPDDISEFISYSGGYIAFDDALFDAGL